MPELCRFRGITIYVNFRDHNPPHFHASHGEHEIVIYLNTFVLKGYMRSRQRRLVLEWAMLHQDELRVAWDRAQRGQSPGRIEPLE